MMKVLSFFSLSLSFLPLRHTMLSPFFSSSSSFYRNERILFLFWFGIHTSLHVCGVNRIFFVNNLNTKYISVASETIFAAQKRFVTNCTHLLYMCVMFFCCFFRCSKFYLWFVHATREKKNWILIECSYRSNCVEVEQEATVWKCPSYRIKSIHCIHIHTFRFYITINDHLSCGHHFPY